MTPEVSKALAEFRDMFFSQKWSDGWHRNLAVVEAALSKPSTLSARAEALEAVAEAAKALSCAHYLDIGVQCRLNDALVRLARLSGNAGGEK